MKKRFLAAAISVAAGCAVVLSGCAGATQNVVSLNSNWYADVNFKKFQPTFDSERSEKIVYAVTHDEKAATNKTYSVKYDEGTYTTEFYTVALGKNSDKILDEFREGYGESTTVYCYKTELNVPKVTFTYKGEPKVFENCDEVITESYFLSVEDRLQPVYARQSVHSVSPNVLNATSLESTYHVYDYEYTTYYSRDGEQAVTKINGADGGSERRASGLKGTQSTLFDATYLDVAVRANKLSPSLSQAISLYLPQSGVGEFVLQGNAMGLNETERTDARNLLIANELFKDEKIKDENGNETDKPLNTSAVSVYYNAEFNGRPQTYWFAAVENPRNNVSRSTLLKIQYSVPFNHGVRNYVIKEIQSNLYNGN